MNFPVQAKNILVIQFRQVGDVLLTTPAVKVLRDHYPNSQMSYLTERGPAVLLQGNPHIDEVIIRDRQKGLIQDLKLACSLRKAKYDLVIDFFCNPRSAWISFVTGAPVRIARHHAGRSWWYTYAPVIQGKNCYAGEERLELLRAIGINGQLVPPIIQVADEAKQYIETFLTQEQISPNTLVITIDPTSRRPAKRWIPERYVQLADYLVEQYGAKVIFIWGLGEHDEVASLIKQGKYRHILACPTDLMQLSALIAKSRLHIGNCSAPRHIAVAVGTPSLTLMGPTSPENWTYPSPLHQVVRGNVPCLGCQKRVCQKHTCMQSLTVREVAQVVEQFFTREARNDVA
jgi:heptosyltransferase-3